jgi:hypothetical protein
MKGREIIILVVILAFLGLVAFMGLKVKSPISNSVNTYGGGLGGGGLGDLGNMLGELFADTPGTATSTASSADDWDLSSNKIAWNQLSAGSRANIVPQITGGKSYYGQGLAIPASHSADFLKAVLGYVP